jgi:hypothetical protein
MCVIHFSVVERNVSWQSNYYKIARKKADRAGGGVAQPAGRRSESLSMLLLL